MPLPRKVERDGEEYTFGYHSFLVMKDDEPWVIVKPLHRRRDPVERPSGYEAYLIDESQSYPDRNATPRDAVLGLIRKVG